MQKILLIDDDPVVRSLISGILRKRGYEVFLAKNGDEGLNIVKESQPDLVITDYQMPGISGMEVLNQINAFNPKLPVVMLTAHGDASLTIKSIQTGAFDYLEKPINPKELLQIVKSGLSTLEDQAEGVVPEVGFTTHMDENLMVGKTPVMREIFKGIGRISQSNVNVMITGENGTGKERLARLIHSSGGDQQGDLVLLNCKKLSEEELRDAYLSLARKQKDSPQVLCSIILDDVGRLTPELQVSLLDLIDRGLGGQFVHSARIISITTQDIGQLVADGRFLKELFYKLKVVSIHLPPLGQRKEDIPELVNHLMRELNPVLNKNLKRVEEGAVQALKSYSWPGNVQELKNVLMQAMIFSHDELLEKKHIQIDSAQQEGDPAVLFDKPPRSLAEVEKEHIGVVLSYTGWNKQESSAILGITRPTLNAKIEKYGLKRG